MLLKFFLLMVFLAFFTPPLHVQAAETTDSGFLWLINQETPLDPAYTPPELVEYKGHRMHPAVLAAYEDMIAAMREDNIHGLYIQSAYRSYSRQEYLFNNRVLHYQNQGFEEPAAIERTARATAYPGASEHQAGLAIDITLDGRLTQNFAETEAGRWIVERAHEFGFITRYPKDKTAITQIMYEPWHLRYVGSPHASFMKEQNLCLEEYITYLAVNKMYIYWSPNRDYFLVSHGDPPREFPIRTTVDTSADRTGEGATFIYTTRRTLPVVP